MNLNSLEREANLIRLDILEMVYNAKSGHLAGALGMADIFTYLYLNYLDVSLIKKNNLKRDFVFLSNGHICAVLYANLARVGIIKKDELKTFRKLGSRLQGHPHYGLIRGVENSGGPLGQGISQAVGCASVLKRENKKNKIFCFLGDGELEEGEVWEAFLFASKEKLNNLIVIVDYNHIQIDGDPAKEDSINNLHKKLTSFGFSVLEFSGNNFKEIDLAFKNIEKLQEKGKPICFIAKTIPGKGISFMENNFHWHGKVPSRDEYEQGKKEIESLF
jgi:transketolase